MSSRHLLTYGIWDAVGEGHLRLRHLLTYCIWLTYGIWDAVGEGHLRHLLTYGIWVTGCRRWGSSAAFAHKCRRWPSLSVNGTMYSEVVVVG